MFLKPFDKVLNKKGGALITVIALSAALTIMMAVFSASMINRKNRSRQTIEQMALDTATQNSFVVLEKSLERRLWEIPLEDDCSKAQEFTVDLEPEGNIHIQITAKMDHDLEALVMTALGSKKGFISGYQKLIKLNDVSDYLILSKKTDSLTIGRTGNESNIAGFIAGPKKIHFEGPLSLSSQMLHASPTKSFTPAQQMIKTDLGMIFQGDRMTFAGGISYEKRSFYIPDSSHPEELAMYNQVASTLGTNLWGHTGHGTAIFTSDIAMATTLKEGIQNLNFSSIQDPNFYQDAMYPYALFCGSTPLFAGNGTDNGCFTNDPHRNFAVGFKRAPPNTYGYRSNWNCFMDSSSKRCSNSNHFPKGFEAWRKKAGLTNTLLTNDATPIQVPKISWENMEALKDEALACGAVLTREDEYEDCDVANHNFLDDYASGGPASQCDKISKLSTANFAGMISGWNPATYKGSRPNKTRKVIYTDFPLELNQLAKSGFWPELTDNEVRENLSLWFVSESYFRLKPYQKDLSSPINSDPGRLRELRFNNGFGDPGDLSPLKLTFLTPEVTEIISPFHVPLTATDMSTIYPRVGGKVHPKRHIYTDHERHEDDGFMYGMRSVLLNNMAFIGSNTHPVNLRGLWAGRDFSSQQMINTRCFMDNPADGLSTGEGGGPRPNHAFVPPPGSRFYNKSSGSDRVPKENLPNVLQIQDDNNYVTSQVLFKGLILNIGFADEDKGGANLSKPRRRVSNPFSTKFFDYFPHRDVEFQGHRFSYTRASPFILRHPPFGEPCTSTKAERFDGSHAHLSPYLNIGAHNLVQSVPNSNFSELGSIFGQPMLVVKDRSR